MLCSGHPEWGTALLFSVQKWAHLLSVKWMPYFVADNLISSWSWTECFLLWIRFQGFFPAADAETGFPLLLLQCSVLTGGQDSVSVFAYLVSLGAREVSSPNSPEVYFHFLIPWFWRLLHLEWLKQLLAVWLWQRVADRPSGFTHMMCNGDLS